MLRNSCPEVDLLSMHQTGQGPASRGAVQAYGCQCTIRRKTLGTELTVAADQSTLVDFNIAHRIFILGCLVNRITAVVSPF